MPPPDSENTTPPAPPPSPPPRAEINKPDDDGNTWLHRLCMNKGTPEDIRAAVRDLGADINKLNKRGLPPLGEALTAKAPPAVISALLDLGAETWLPTVEGKHFNAIVTAAWNVQPDSLDIILARKGAAHVNDPGLLVDTITPEMPALHIAVHRSTVGFTDVPDCIRMAKSLGRAGAFVGLEAGPQKLAPLMMASKNWSVGMVEGLREIGADMEQAQSQTGMRPLHFSIKEQRGDVADYYLKEGVNPDSVTLDGTSGLMMAADLGSAAMENRLIAKHANVNYQQPFGDRHTALMRAGIKGEIDGIKPLLDADADPLLADAFNRRASQLVDGEHINARVLLERAEENAAFRHFDKAYDRERKRRGRRP